MWHAKFVSEHDSCLIAPLCIKHNITDYLYLLNAWTDKENFYYTELHIPEGEKEDIKKFIIDLKKEKTIESIEQVGNTVYTLNKRETWIARYSPLWDRQLIHTKPITQLPNGKEIWELAAWSKEPITNILKLQNKDFRIKLISIENKLMNEAYPLQIIPKLSSKQKKALLLAVENGLYDAPRKTNLEKLAKGMKITKQTYGQHLKAAEKKLLGFLVEKMDP
ncbi:MAG: helix-turn-helix domain-containing protein [archaeon]|jgi:predicted DNA binding protein